MEFMAKVYSGFLGIRTACRFFTGRIGRAAKCLRAVGKSKGKCTGRGRRYNATPTSTVNVLISKMLADFNAFAAMAAKASKRTGWW
jgi:hypothetical protein